MTMTAMRLKSSRPGETFRTKAWAWFQRTRDVALPAAVDPGDAEERANSPADLVRKHLRGVLEAILSRPTAADVGELCKAARPTRRA